MIHRDLLGESLPVTPQPDVDLIQQAPCPAGGLRISSCYTWTLISVFVRNGIDGVAVQVAWNQRHASKHIPLGRRRLGVLAPEWQPVRGHSLCRQLSGVRLIG